MDAKALGSFILTLRKEKDMTQAQLAEKIHVTDKAISKWERGVGIPDISNLEALADALDITVAELLQCKKQDKVPVSPEELKDLTDAALKLAKYQEQHTRRRLLIGMLLAAAGFILLFAGIRFFLSPAITIIGGADGPTSIFVAGKISKTIPSIAIAAGAILVFTGLWKILKKKLP